MNFINFITMENWKPNQSKLMQKQTLICLIFISLFCNFSESSARRTSSGADFDHQKVGVGKNLRDEEYGSPHVDGAWRKRPKNAGSSPPNCRGKCGGCNPCTPTRITVPPKGGRGERLMMSAEYYPQEWKCSCGGNLYHP